MKMSVKEFAQFAVANGNNKIPTLTDIKASQPLPYRPERDYYKYLREGIQSYEAGNITLHQLQTLNLGLSDQRKVTGYQAPQNAYTTWRGQFVGIGAEVVKRTWSHRVLDVVVNPTVCIQDNGIKNHIFVNFKKEPVSVDTANVITTIMNEVYNSSNDRSFVLNARSNVMLTANTAQNHLLRVQMEAAAITAIWNQI